MSQWYEAVVWISSEFEDESRERGGEHDMRSYWEDSCLASLLYLFQVRQDIKICLTNQTLGRSRHERQLYSSKVKKKKLIFNIPELQILIFLITGQIRYTWCRWEIHKVKYIHCTICF